MTKRSVAGFLAALLWVATPSLPLHAAATTAPSVEPARAAAIVAALKRARPEFEYVDIKPSPVAGIVQVQVVGGPLLYVVGNGEFFFSGDLYQVTPDAFVNIRELELMAIRKERIAAVPRKEAIVFAPAGPAKAVINVFTDVDCGYCRLFHKEVPGLNQMGVEVHYLAFPRAGIDSDVYRKHVSAWCAKDPRKALTTLKGGGAIPDNQCPGNPVAKQFELGRALGVNGTPSIVLADGTLLPGFMPAAELGKLLGLGAAPAALVNPAGSIDSAGDAP